jgi:hypothetical protein
LKLANGIEDDVVCDVRVGYAVVCIRDVCVLSSGRGMQKTDSGSVDDVVVVVGQGEK